MDNASYVELIAFLKASYETYPESVDPPRMGQAKSASEFSEISDCGGLGTFDSQLPLEFESLSLVDGRRRRTATARAGFRLLIMRLPRGRARPCCCCSGSGIGS